MDRVRFGRALGFGARQAGKTVARAVAAATAEDPSDRRTEPEAHKPAQTVSPLASGVRKAAQSASQSATRAREVQRGVQRGSRRFGEAIWGPFVRLSGVLWLEVTGVFFGIFALIALNGVWRLRGAWHQSPANAQDHRSLLGAIAMLAVFGYFCVSSFVRARRRERRR